LVPIKRTKIDRTFKTLNFQVNLTILDEFRWRLINLSMKKSKKIRLEIQLKEIERTSDSISFLDQLKFLAILIGQQMPRHWWASRWNEMAKVFRIKVASLFVNFLPWRYRPLHWLSLKEFLLWQSIMHSYFIYFFGSWLSKNLKWHPWSPWFFQNPGCSCFLKLVLETKCISNYFLK